ncbi:MAG TPA: hypothetical protein VIQ76_06215 [Propionibacteriaceae bacterium]
MIGSVSGSSAASKRSIYADNNTHEPQEPASPRGEIAAPRRDVVGSSLRLPSSALEIVIEEGAAAPSRVIPMA